MRIVFTAFNAEQNALHHVAHSQTATKKTAALCKLQITVAFDKSFTNSVKENR